MAFNCGTPGLPRCLRQNVNACARISRRNCAQVRVIYEIYPPLHRGGAALTEVARVENGGVERGLRVGRFRPSRNHSTIQSIGGTHPILRMGAVSAMGIAQGGREPARPAAW